MADKLITIRVPEDTVRLDYTTKDNVSGFDSMQPITVGMLVRVEDAPDRTCIENKIESEE
mgnify:CR=1 FL=1